MRLLQCLKTSKVNQLPSDAASFLRRRKTQTNILSPEMLSSVYIFQNYFHTTSCIHTLGIWIMKACSPLYEYQFFQEHAALSFEVKVSYPEDRGHMFLQNVGANLTNSTWYHNPKDHNHECSIL